MTLPTFIGIGAQRAATTWVYECLKEHPQIFMASKKEIHFFNTQFDKDLSWYEDHFEGASDFVAVGEITPNYLNNPDAIPRMARVLPKATLLVILREPISRAYSAYRLLGDQFKGVSFQQACQKTDYLLRLSCYAEDLKRVFAHYDREQVGIFLYEDVRQRPYEMLADIYIRLGVDMEYKPKSAKQIYNPVVLPGLQKILKTAGLSAVLEALKKKRLGKWLKLLLVQRQRRNILAKKGTNQGGVPPDPIGMEYRNQLKKYFRQDILETQKIIGRDLTNWL